MTVRRRDLLKAGAAASVVSGVGAALLGCVEREEKFFEQVTGRENDRSGVSRWTGGVCGQCAAGCTTLVRTVDGNAKKIEGAPQHPLSRGGLCALGQSALQEVYDPDRLRQPMVRSGARGDSALQPASWEEAVQRIVATSSASGAGRRRFAILSPVHDALENRVYGALARSVRGEHFAYEPVWRAAERAAARQLLGWEGVPSYDLANADLVVSFGAPLLDRWRNPVWAAAVLRGERQNGGAQRPTLVQVQPRFGLSEAASDLWLAPRPGTEGVLAEALESALRATSAQSEPSATSEASEASLRAACSVCDVPHEKAARLLELLRTASRPVVVAGGAWVSGHAPSGLIRDGGAPPPLGLAAVVAALRLDVTLGRVGESGGVFPPAPSPLRVPFDLGGPDRLPPPQGFDALLGRLRAEEVGTLILVDVDEALSGADAPLLRELLAGVDQVVSLATMPGATSAVSDVVLPVHAALERWHLGVAENAAPGALVVAAEPVVRPVASTLHPADVALSIGKALLAESSPGEALTAPFTADGAGSLFDEAVAATAEVAGQRASELLERGFLAFPLTPEQLAASTRQPRPAVFADRGGLESEDLGVTSALAGGSEPEGGGAAGSATSEGEEPRQPPEATDVDAGGPGAAGAASGFILLPYETPHLAAGRGANRPWLQQLPDPLTTVMWSSWAELAPQDLARLGLRSGDWVEISGERGATLQAPVVENPAARPGVVAVPLSDPRAQGRYAAGRGLDLALLGAAQVAGLGRRSTTGLPVTIRKIAADDVADRTPLALFGRGLRHHEDLPTRRGRRMPQTVRLEKPRRGAPASAAEPVEEAEIGAEGQDVRQGAP